jgi:hypothetical protein
MRVFLCLPISAMGYFSGGFLMVFGFFEAGVGICAFCDAGMYHEIKLSALGYNHV